MADSNGRAGRPSRILLLFCLAGALVLCAVLVQLLLSRYKYQTAVELLRQDKITEARTELENSLAALPGFSAADALKPETHSSVFFTNDLQRIDKAFGDLFFQKASTAMLMHSFFTDMQTAEKYYKAAAALNPFDVEAVMGLVKTTAALEKVHAFMHKKDPSPYNALPIFESLLRLRPEGIEAHYLLLRYLQDHAMDARMMETAANLMRIYPPAYNGLKTEPFYSTKMYKVVQSGLNEAIAEKNFSKDAYIALSDIELVQGNIDTAVSLYSEALKVKAPANALGHYSQMGRLFLKAEEFPKASEVFLLAVRMGEDRDTALRSIWGIHQGEKQYKPFLDFLKLAETEFGLAEVKDILQARCLIQLEQYELARSHLIKISMGHYQAESLSLQADIAAKRKDWDEMELTSQRATVLEPARSEYHSLLAQALRNQKKYPQAEEAAGKAIASSPKPSPWLFNQRGWIRWNRNNVEGAAEDWQKAITLEPTRPDLHYSMALAREKEQNYPVALTYARTALKLKPGNANYLRKVEELTEKGGLKAED